MSTLQLIAIKHAIDHKNPAIALIASKAMDIVAGHLDSAELARTTQSVALLTTVCSAAGFIYERDHASIILHDIATKWFLEHKICAEDAYEYLDSEMRIELQQLGSQLAKKRRQQHDSNQIAAVGS